MEAVPIRRTESHFEGARGQTLFHRAWLPREVERVLLVVHGLGEHSGRYEDLGAWFASRGCAVHAYDQVGHGRSAGAPGHLRRFSDFVDDLQVALDHVRAEHRGAPLFPLGHSVGGLVLLTLLREPQPGLAGAVTSAAALAHPPSAGRARLLLGRAARWVAPRLRIDSGVDPGELSRDPEVGREYAADPLVRRKLTLRCAAELLGAIERAGAEARVDVPLLMLHGEADRLCPPEGSRALHARLAGSRLVTYADLRHELFHEPERARIFGDVLDWLREVGKPTEGGACARTDASR